MLATFSHHVVDVSKFKNSNFLAKDIKDNIVLYQVNQSTVLSITKTVQKSLSQRDNLWTLTQKRLENLLELLGDNNYLTTLLHVGLLHASVLDLPTNDDRSKLLDCHTEEFFS